MPTSQEVGFGIFVSCAAVGILLAHPLLIGFGFLLNIVVILFTVVQDRRVRANGNTTLAASARHHMYVLSRPVWAGGLGLVLLAMVGHFLLNAH
jgi:hypothetical protein